MIKIGLKKSTPSLESSDNKTMNLNPCSPRLESFCLGDVDSNFEIPVQKLVLEAELRPNSVAAMKSGEWIMMNTMPWFLGSKGGNSFQRLFKSNMAPDVVFGIKVADLTAAGVDLEGLPRGMGSVSFIHRSSLVFVTQVAKFKKFV